MNRIVRKVQSSRGIVLKFAAVIAILLLGSAVTYAAITGYKSIETENGSLTGNASTVADASSSSGNAVKFGTEETDPGGGDDCTVPTVGAGGYPLPDLTGRANPCNTGPRYECTSTYTGNFATSSDGQVIDRMCINGELRVNHDNVTIRDTKIVSGGLYGLDIGRDSSTCPANTLIEYVEIDKSPAQDSLPWGTYQRCAGGHKPMIT